jgi:hypothetical protein
MVNNMASSSLTDEQIMSLPFRDVTRLCRSVTGFKGTDRCPKILQMWLKKNVPKAFQVKKSPFKEGDPPKQWINAYIQLRLEELGTLLKDIAKNLDKGPDATPNEDSAAMMADIIKEAGRADELNDLALNRAPAYVEVAGLVRDIAQRLRVEPHLIGERPVAPAAPSRRAGLFLKFLVIATGVRELFNHLADVLDEPELRSAIIRFRYQQLAVMPVPERQVPIIPPLVLYRVFKDNPLDPAALPLELDVNEYAYLLSESLIQLSMPNFMERLMSPEAENTLISALEKRFKAHPTERILAENLLEQVTNRALELYLRGPPLNQRQGPDEFKTLLKDPLRIASLTRDEIEGLDIDKLKQLMKSIKMYHREHGAKLQEVKAWADSAHDQAILDSLSATPSMLNVIGQGWVDNLSSAHRQELRTQLVAWAADPAIQDATILREVARVSRLVATARHMGKAGGGANVIRRRYVAR